MPTGAALKIGLCRSGASERDFQKACAPWRRHRERCQPTLRALALLRPEAAAASLLVHRCAEAGFFAARLRPMIHADLTTTNAILRWLLCLLGALPAGAAAFFMFRPLLETHASWRRRTAARPPQVEEKVLYGVDVSKSNFLTRQLVEAAVHFAATAHKGQMRLTNEPYVTHCISSALIFEELLSAFVDDSRAEEAVMAAVLHDVLDDTKVTVEEVESAFGPAVANLVQQVSQLSSMVQLLRRRRRVMEGDNATEQVVEEDDLLRTTILKSAREPLVLLIKLADRLHNMRTVYALNPAKRRAVACETRSIFCRLAERLGLFALKAELEDLSFAVTQPQEFRQVYTELCGLWDVSGFMDGSSTANGSTGFGNASTPLLPLRPSDTEDELPRSAMIYMDEPLCFSHSDTLTGDVHYHKPMQSTMAGALTSADRGGALLDTPVPSTSSSARMRRSGPLGSSPQCCKEPSRFAVLLGEDPGISGCFPKGDGITQRNSAHSNVRPDDSPSTSHEQQDQTSSSGGVAVGRQESELGQNTDSIDTASEPAILDHLNDGAPLTWEQLASEDCKQMLACVNPFTSVMFTWSGPGGNMGFGLNFLRSRTEELLQEISILSFGAGYSIEVYGRVKSLYSTYKKMKRKGVSINEVYDVLALRVVVDDEGDSESSAARMLCYQLLSTVQRLWKPVRSELDDYIAVPKHSGYQSLHTSVIGPKGVPFEVQIRTRSMHVDAEYGSAAHWTYKELPILSDEEGLQGQESGSLRVGQPVVRICNGRYLDGIIVRCEHNQRHLLVAVNLQEQVQRTPGSRVASSSEYQQMAEYVEKMGWHEAGQGDINMVLEHYVLCVDGAYHKVDHYGHKQKIVARPLEFPHEEVGLGPSGRQMASESAGERRTRGGDAASNIQREINLKAQYLRQMLDFCVELDLECPDSDTIHVMVWPEGQIRSFPSGTTAGEVLLSTGTIEIMGESEEPRGPASKLVNVNNQLVGEDTALKDGDYVILSRDLVKI
eukprot:evm.model.scf_465EXC.2 EVM.evm.TU.scf_465EXC.2   scf_465EXC:15283-21782(+)